MKLIRSGFYLNNFNNLKKIKMVQLTKDLTRTYELGDINEYPILGGEIIYQGAAIGLEVASGYVRPLQATDKFVGFAEDNIDASNASDGEKNIRVKRRGSVTLELSGAAITDVGKSLYATDDINQFIN
jgi:hypothetical protein